MNLGSPLRMKLPTCGSIGMTMASTLAMILVFAGSSPVIQASAAAPRNQSSKDRESGGAALSDDASWGREITAPLVDRDRIVRLDVGAELRRSTRADLSDLSVVDPGGASVPFRIERVRERRRIESERRLTTTLEEVVEGADGNLTLIVAVDEPQSRVTERAEGARIARLEVETPLQDFERRVSIDAATDDGGWQPLASDLPIFDYRRYADVRSVTIELPSTSSRRFRLTISRAVDLRESAWREWVRIGGGDQADEAVMERVLVEQRPFRIDAMTAVEVAEIESDWRDELRRLDPVPTTIAEDASLDATVLELSVERQPVTRLELGTSTRNLLRPIEVQARDDDRQEWRTVARRTISRISVGGSERTALAIEFPETVARQLRIVIAHEGQGSLADLQAALFGPIDRVLFLAESGAERFELRYGGAESPSDTARELFDSVLETNSGLESVDGIAGEPYRRLTTVAAEEPGWPWWALYVVVGLMLVVLLLGIVSAARRVGPADDGSEPERHEKS